MGPWKHVFPDLSPVAPVGFLEMMVRWFDRWLKGEANGAEAGPPITLYVQGWMGWPDGEFASPSDRGVEEQLHTVLHRRGWRHEDAWPPTRNEQSQFYLEGLYQAPLHVSSMVLQMADFGSRLFLGRTRVVYPHDPTVGLDSLAVDPWTTAVSHGAEPWGAPSLGVGGDHDSDDARSLCFTSPPLGADWELAGQPRVVLYVSAEPGLAEAGLNLVAKLCDVSPAGRSRLVTLGWAKGPSQGQVASAVEIPLRSTSYFFRQDHRIRLSIALADFPRLWPTPGGGTFRLHWGVGSPSSLILPNCPAQQPVSPAVNFPPPGTGLKSPAELEAVQRWHVGRELVERTASLQCHTATAYQLSDGGTVRYSHNYTATVAESAPAAAEMRSAADIVVQRPSGEVRIQSNNVFTATTVTINAEVTQNGQVIFRKQWSNA
jgi:putative CocE/NonD family hydrolase